MVGLFETLAHITMADAFKTCAGEVKFVFQQLDFVWTPECSFPKTVGSRSFFFPMGHPVGPPPFDWKQLCCRDAAKINAMGSFVFLDRSPKM
jgi:hypothetical protein